MCASHIQLCSRNYGFPDDCVFAKFHHAQGVSEPRASVSPRRAFSRVVPDSIGSVLRPQTRIFQFVMFPISGCLDMRKLLPGTFQDFMFGILTKWACFLKNVETLTCKLYIYIHTYIVGKYHIWLDIYIFCWFQSLPAGCVCVRAACGASATSEKHGPGFWNMDFVICEWF